MASNPPSKCCFMGFRHEGQPKGSLQEIFGLETYIAKPQVSHCCKSTKVTYEDKYIVILTDIYGHKFNNVQLIADELANKTGLSEWLSKHSPEKTRNEAVQPFLQKLRDEKKPSFVGVIGYCFGAKFAIQQLAEDGLADVGAVAHPSFVTIEEVAAITKEKSLLISAAETDPVFTEELRHQTEAKLMEKGNCYQLDLFSGVSHGFAARGDISDPWVKYCKEKALADQIHWFTYFANQGKN
ncbi:protein AIM2 PWA37_002333 [Arxiozyma heterogenica]|uniref:protein AIM2 n=1 Tax=Arxiozyma heterogenica TaxID=278026 RepID=UPI002F010EAD